MAQINKSNEYFNTKLYTQNASTNAITGVNFQPDFTWIKNRDSGTRDHRIFDSVRGANKPLKVNGTNAEATETDTLNSFDSDGFTLGADTQGYGVNDLSGNNTVSWNWLAGGTGVSNTDGSITSTVSANTISGFSIGTYTGTGASATIGHGLGTSPSMVIIKRTDSAENWRVHHVGLTGLTYRLALDTTQAEYDETTSGLQSWNSSTFTLGSGGSYNASGGSFVFYAFAEKKGFSKAFSYTGNGSTDGSFTYLGFRPAFCIIKRTDSASDWVILDNKRNSFNVVDKKLESSNSDADTTQTACDFLSNGIKLKDTTTSYLGTNISGGTYIYMAFAESPLVGTNNIPAVAR